MQQCKTSPKVEIDITISFNSGSERAFILNKLETLILNQNSFNESGKELSSLKILPSIRNLDLSGNELSGPFPPKGTLYIYGFSKIYGFF